jgi:hypothetical protein
VLNSQKRRFPVRAQLMDGEGPADFWLRCASNDAGMRPGAARPAAKTDDGAGVAAPSERIAAGNEPRRLGDSANTTALGGESERRPRLAPENLLVIGIMLAGVLGGGAFGLWFERRQETRESQRGPEFDLADYDVNFENPLAVDSADTDLVGPPASPSFEQEIAAEPPLSSSPFENESGAEPPE